MSELRPGFKGHLRSPEAAESVKGWNFFWRIILIISLRMPLQKVFLLYRWVGRRSSKKQLFYADILYILHLDSRLKLLCTYVIYWENRNTLLLRFRNLEMIVWILFIWKIFYVVCKNMTRNGHKWLEKVVKWPFTSRNFWAPLDKLC